MTGDQLVDNNEPPEDCFCDLVMKGGITSGVVYPEAIEKLSHYYRFQSIGGTSAGAIAAAVTAAAEYQRRRTGSRAGFNLLKAIPSQLGETVNGDRRLLLSLFQPQPAMRRLFSVLIGALNKTSATSRVLSVGLGLVRAYWGATLIALLIAGAIGVFGGRLEVISHSVQVGNPSMVTAAFLLFIIVLPLLIGACVYYDITRKLPANNFGLCSGLSPDSRFPALTPWLHDLIQRASGRAVDGEPLTFGDLSSAPGFPPKWLENSKRPSINLQMFSTNLSHGRPYIFPLTKGSSPGTQYRDRDRLYFKEEDMARCLPKGVVEWMVKHSRPYTLEQGRAGKDPSSTDRSAKGMLELPDPEKFPVLLAARMSLSFPFLFTAVKLYAIDHGPPNNRKFHACWFSDGGISSNFPMHLFDGLVPMWPTFGINLEPKIQGRGDVFLPEKYDQGYGECWNHFDEHGKGPSMVGGFIAGIVGAMQNWNDNSLARMPGIRDRVARVRLSKEEGGMNLDMDKNQISSVADKGRTAVDLLLNQFAGSRRGDRLTNGWDNHRFVRLVVLLKMLEARSSDVSAAVSPNCGHVTNYSELLKRMKNATDAGGTRLAPPGFEAPLTDQQHNASVAFLTELDALATAMAAGGSQVPFKAIPCPELRIRPPL